MRGIFRFGVCAVLLCASGTGGARGGTRSGDHTASDASHLSPHRNRLLLLPDARTMPAWEGYVAVHDLFFPVMAIGVGPFASISGGATLAPWLEGQSFLLSGFITPWSTEALAIAAGGAVIGSRGDETGVGIVMITAGGAAGTGTAGLGWGFAGEELKGKPVLRLGFRTPFSGDVELLGEAWFPPSFDPALLAAGWRYSLGGLSIDLAALFASRKEDGGPAPLLPWLTIAFGF